jgi:hypothetical protein
LGESSRSTCLRADGCLGADDYLGCGAELGLLISLVPSPPSKKGSDTRCDTSLDSIRAHVCHLVFSYFGTVYANPWNRGW